MAPIDLQRALDVQLGDNDAEVETVREYLKELLATLLIEEESFSGKRPFGNSGWINELTEPLEEAGFEIDGDFWSDLVAAL